MHSPRALIPCQDMDIACEVCGTPCKPRLDRRPRFCSQRCCGLAKAKRQRPCEACGQEVARKGDRFCSVVCQRSCHQRFMGTPEMRARMSENARRQHAKDPGLARRSSERMVTQNPMADQATRRLASSKLKAMKYRPVSRGGNGRGLTVPQQALLEALGHGWAPELAVPTKMSRGSGYPTSYKLDLGNTALKLGIEVDGPSHDSPRARAKDGKKSALLATLGWRVLRVRNEAILSDAASALATIRAWMSST